MLESLFSKDASLKKVLLPSKTLSNSGTSQRLASYQTNTPLVFHVETTWKRRRFNVEYTWCVYRDDFPCSSCIWGNMAKVYLGLRQTSDMERDVHLLIV